MINAVEVKTGMALQIDGKIYRVLEVVRHAGSGQMHGFIELKLNDIRYHHFADRRFKHTDKLEEVELARRPMDYLYSDSEGCWFMDPDTFEQVSIPKPAIGNVEKFMKEGMRITVELLGGEAIAVQFPKVVELTIAATGPGIRGGQDNTLKPATLENGVEILVPQFIEPGERVRIDTEKSRYIERVTVKSL